MDQILAVRGVYSRNAAWQPEDQHATLGRMCNCIWPKGAPRSGAFAVLLRIPSSHSLPKVLAVIRIDPILRRIVFLFLRPIKYLLRTRINTSFSNFCRKIWRIIMFHVQYAIFLYIQSEIKEVLEIWYAFNHVWSVCDDKWRKGDIFFGPTMQDIVYFSRILACARDHLLSWHAVDSTILQNPDTRSVPLCFLTYLMDAWFRCVAIHCSRLVSITIKMKFLLASIESIR